MAASYGCMLGNFVEAAIDFGWVFDDSTKSRV